MFLLESPHRGVSSKNIQYTIFNIKRKSPLIILSLQLCEFFQGIQKRVRNSRGKRAISNRATEGLLYFIHEAPINLKNLTLIILLAFSSLQIINDGILGSLEYKELFPWSIRVSLLRGIFRDWNQSNTVYSFN